MNLYFYAYIIFLVFQVSFAPSLAVKPDSTWLVKSETLCHTRPKKYPFSLEKVIKKFLRHLGSTELQLEPICRNRESLEWVIFMKICPIL